jgi:hypothetical protein
MTTAGSFVGIAVLGAVVGVAGLGCGAHASRAARSQQSFDHIQQQVTGRTEAEVERMLGTPDARESRLVDDEVWIWWDYTFLDGEQYPPEVRGQVVHLEITFDQPPGSEAGRDVPRGGWRVAGPFAVNFSRRAPRS